ncbi:MAG: hypothetical protein IT337_16915 [Thermomicrobiales bacterium]|nr:hypothetical protein [Thermomicrobiales bacterium]
MSITFEKCLHCDGDGFVGGGGYGLRRDCGNCYGTGEIATIEGGCQSLDIRIAKSLAERFLDAERGVVPMSRNDVGRVAAAIRQAVKGQTP